MMTEADKRTYAEICSLMLVGILFLIFWSYFGSEIAIAYFAIWSLLKYALECPVNQ